jgi:hypothetical protein
VTPVLEFALWLIFGSITVGGLGLAGLLVWVTVRAMVRGSSGLTHLVTPSPIAVPAFGSVTVRNSIGIVGTIWLTLLVLAPLLALALWQFAVELEKGQAGGSLVLASVHLVLIWALLRLGTRVQRKVDLSGSGLVVAPGRGAASRVCVGRHHARRRRQLRRTGRQRTVFVRDSWACCDSRHLASAVGITAHDGARAHASRELELPEPRVARGLNRTSTTENPPDPSA